jgi:hypothetical protein
MARNLVIALVLILALSPSPAFAQAGVDAGGVVMRVDGDATVDEGSRVDTLVVIDGNARVDGEVEDFLMIISGTAEISGRVAGDVVAIDSDVSMAEGSVVEGDMALIDSSLSRLEGAEVLGEISDDWEPRLWMWFVLNLFLWLGMTILVLVAGLALVAVAPRQAERAAGLMFDAPWWSALAALIAWVAVPVVAVIAIVTLVGIPVGLWLLLFVLPMIALLGYLIGGLRLGKLILSAFGDNAPRNLYLAALMGIGLLQLMLLIPFLGGIVVTLLAFWGSGALALLAWRSFRRQGGSAAA